MDDKGKIDHGGPAFPIPAVYSEGQGVCQGWDGMTLRDYFAARAPIEPQKWFDPVFPEFDHNSPDASYQDWTEARAKQRYTKWPYAWADEMIKVRSAK